MGWSSKGFPLFFLVVNLPTIPPTNVRRAAARSAAGDPSALDNPPPPREEMVRASGCRRAIKLTRMAASRINLDTHTVELVGTAS